MCSKIAIIFMETHRFVFSSNTAKEKIFRLHQILCNEGSLFKEKMKFSVATEKSWCNVQPEVVKLIENLFKAKSNFVRLQINVK